jgi:hypothetical protein
MKDISSNSSSISFTVGFQHDLNWSIRYLIGGVLKISAADVMTSRTSYIVNLFKAYTYADFEITFYIPTNAL